MMMMKNGQDTLENDPLSERPSTSRTEVTIEKEVSISHGCDSAPTK